MFTLVFSFALFANSFKRFESCASAPGGLVASLCLHPGKDGSDAGSWHAAPLEGTSLDPFHLPIPVAPLPPGCCSVPWA